MASKFAVCAAAVVLAVSAVAPAAGSPGARPETGYQVKEMITGAQIRGANGLAVDPDGQLLVASVFGAEIVVVDPLTGAVSDRLGTSPGSTVPTMSRSVRMGRSTGRTSSPGRWAGWRRMARSASSWWHRG